MTGALGQNDGELIRKVDSLKKQVKDRENIVSKLEDEFESMSEVINSYIEMSKSKDIGAASRSESRNEKPERDCLVFHGVDVDDMERMTGDPDIRKNFLDHNIKKLLKSEWGIECSVPFKHVFRWSDGPRVNGVEPILVIFDDIKEKELIWNKLRDNLQTKTNVVVTQDSSTKRMKKTSVASKSDIGGPPRSPRKTAVVKPTTVNDPEPEKRNAEDIRQKKPSLGQQIVSASKPRKLSRTASVSSVVSRSPKKSLSRMESIAASEPLPEDDVYNGLDASMSLMIHGVESDWIEEEMADDDDFRKDVLEQKVKKALEEIGFSKRVMYKNLFRWSDGPPHAGVPPVVVIFKDKKDRVEVYNAAREGFKKNGWVVTEDSKSRLGGQKPKEISSKLNFASFLDHYQSYPIAQQLFNKMIRLL